MKDDGLTLMVTDDLSRYFLVPDDAELPFGDLSLRTVGGRRRFVDDKAMTPYEVPREKADQRMKAKVEALFATLRDAVTRDETGKPRQAISPAVQRDAQLLINGLREIMTGIRAAIAEDREKKS